MSQPLTLTEERQTGTKQVVVTENVVYDHTGPEGELEGLVSLTEFYRKLTEI